ncbi:MAG: aromatic compound degradation protein PaaI [Actinomycetota bacterium]|nr:MAG: aromatic compound degradation protein PaaI [Actinomycetota bacterium]
MTPSDRLTEVRERFAASAFHRSFFGMTLERVAEGEVDVALVVEDRHRNLLGIVHGGVIATLADTATGLAYRTVLEPGTQHVTTQLNVTYLAAGRGGRLVARGRVVKRGRRTGYAEADVLDGEGRLLARATALFAVLPEAAQ